MKFKLSKTPYYKLNNTQKKMSIKYTDPLSILCEKIYEYAIKKGKVKL